MSANFDSSLCLSNIRSDIVLWNAVGESGNAVALTLSSGKKRGVDVAREHCFSSLLVMMVVARLACP